MPKYGASREMSQSASALSPSPSSHSRALFATCDCSRPSCVHAFRKATHFGSDRREEVMLGRLQHRRRAGERRVRVLQVGRRVNAAAVLAGVAVLILGAADGTLPLDVAVGEEHPFHRVIELLDRARVDEAGLLEPAVDVLRQRNVLGRVRRVPVVEGDVKALEVARALGGDPRDERLRRNPLVLGLQHDRRAVRVVRADEVHRVAPACAGIAPRCRPGCTP